MKYIQLNDTDLNVSRICLGTAGFGDKTDQEKSFEADVSKSWMILYGQVEILLIQPMYTASGWKDTETAVSRS